MRGGWVRCTVVSTRILIATFVGLTTCPLAAQETADPALELYYAANAAYNRKLYPIAATNYQQFLGKYGNHQKAQLARYGLGLSHYALKQYDKAAPQFQNLLAAGSLDGKIERGRLTMLHAQCLLYTNRKDEAQQRLIAASGSLKPGVHRNGAIAAVTDLYFEKKDWQNTIDWARKLQAAKAPPEQLVRAGFQEGFALHQLKKFPEAIVVLERTKSIATGLKSTDWVTRVNHLVSECEVSNKNLAKAEAALQSALQGLTGESQIDAFYRLAKIKFAQKKWDVSKADFEAFLKANKKPEQEDPRVRDARFHAARCLMELKNNNQANQQFEHLGRGNDEVAARAVLWRGRLHSRDEKRENRYELAANVLRTATDKEWYKKGLPARQGQKPTTLVADIDFEHANALMLQKTPNWEEALKLLQRVQSRRGDYAQMAEVLSQQAICQHKLKQFQPSFQTTARFLKDYASHKLIADMRFLHAENQFLMNKLDEAAASYAALLAAHREHEKRLAARFRIAQVRHHQQKWAESNELAVPLLAEKPQGEVFAQLSFVVGDNYFRLSKWSEAVEALTSFLEAYLTQPKNEKKPAKLAKKAPNVDTALVQLGVGCARLDKKEEAVRHLYMLVANYPNDSPHLPLALSELGKLLYEAGDQKRARQTLETFVRYRKDANNQIFKSGSANAEEGRVHYYLGWLDAGENRHPQAAENFALAAAKSGDRRGKGGVPLAADAALQQGIALVSSKEFEKAAQHLQQVANRFKEHPRKDLVTYYTGLAFARIEKWPQAATFFQRVVEQHPEAPFADKAAYEWAWCERSQKRNKEATARYELLLSKYPQSELATKAQSELAELNLDAGAQDAVIARLTEAIQKVSDPKLKFELQYQLASAHFKKKDYENSARMLEAVIPGAKDSPLLPSILFQAGESRLALTEIVPAREHYLAAHKAKNVPPALAESILMRLAETQNMTGQHKEAHASYRKFLERYRESQWVRNARYGLAYALEKQQQYGKAIGEYAQLLPRDGDQSLKIDKWMVQGRFQIGECYFNMKQYDKAMAEFVSVDTNAQGYPDWQAKAVLEMGRILLTQGKKDEALARMKEVMKRFPKTKAAAVALKYVDELRTGS